MSLYHKYAEPQMSFLLKEKKQTEVIICLQLKPLKRNYLKQGVEAGDTLYLAN